MNKFLWILILVVIVGGIWWAMKAPAPVAPAPEAAPAAAAPAPAPAPAVVAPASSFTVSDQKAGKEVMIAALVLGEAASIVVHKETGGGPGAVIGTLTLKAGSYKDVKVALTEATKAGDSIYPMLHPDNGDGQYKPEEEGTPLNDAAGKALLVKVKVLK